MSKFDPLRFIADHAGMSVIDAISEAYRQGQQDAQSSFSQAHENDCISRAAAIRWVKTECNPYGNPTLEFESDKRVIEHLRQMPSAQPELRWIPVSERLPEENGEYLVTREAKGIYKYVDIVKKTNTSGDIASDIVAWMPLPEPWKEGADG